MAYDASLYNPYGAHVRQKPINGLISIDSIEGGQMYPMPPDSVSPPLFLNEEDAFLIKRTDGGGAATLKKYSFTEVPLQDKEDSELYVTKEHFDNWANQIMEVINGKHIVSEQSKQEQ